MLEVIIWWYSHDQLLYDKIWSEDSTWRIGSEKNLRAKHIGAPKHVAPQESGDSDRESTRSSRFLLQIFLKLLVSQSFCVSTAITMGIETEGMYSNFFKGSVSRKPLGLNHQFQPSQAALGMVSLKVPIFIHWWVVMGSSEKNAFFWGGSYKTAHQQVVL